MYAVVTVAPPTNSILTLSRVCVTRVQGRVQASSCKVNGVPREQVCALQARHRLLPGLAAACAWWGKHTGQRAELETLGDMVKEVAAEPAKLTPKLLQELPKALAACQCSITLREHVATFFPDDDGAQQGHRHFLGLLKSWHSTLKEALHAERRDVTESARFENYYEVLQVDEDYFPDDETFVVEKGAPKSAKADRKRLFDEAFAEDLRLEVVYFFLELEELVEGVFTVYDQVKKQQRTMVEATVVVKLAMEAASALTARLQLSYPALKTAEDVFNIVKSKMHMSFMMRIADTVATSWGEFQKNGTYRFVPGMLIVDFMCVTSTLSSFTTAIPKSPREAMVLQGGFFGPTYGEERTPHYVLPDPSILVVFLMQQLPHLYNCVIAKKAATGTGYAIWVYGLFHGANGRVFHIAQGHSSFGVYVYLLAEIRRSTTRECRAQSQRESYVYPLDEVTEEYGGDVCEGSSSD